MNALKLKTNREKRERYERLKKEVSKACEDFHKANIENALMVSRGNALLHLVHTMIVMGDMQGFGRKRYARAFNRLNEADEQFRKDLQDGVAWYKMKQKLLKYGIEFSEEDDKLCLEAEKLHEKGVMRNG